MSFIGVLGDSVCHTAILHYYFDGKIRPESVFVHENAPIAKYPFGYVLKLLSWR